MASVSVAIGIWKYLSDFSPNSPTDYEQRWALRGRMSELIDELPLPESFREDIDNYSSKLNEFVDHWASYHYNTIFRYEKDRKGYDFPYHYANCIVWHSNGAVDYYKTALNLLKSDDDGLSDLEKYRIACTYCLKEEIEKRWPILIKNKASVKAEFPKEDANVTFNYWNCYCAGKLNLVPVPENLSIDEFMFLQVDNWPAIEYFFDRLVIERQVAGVVSFIDGRNFEFQERLLLKLNESQRLQVYARKAVRIIQNYLSLSELALTFINPPPCEHEAISTWYEVRDLITGSQFVGLMNRLVRDRPPASNDFLMEIWTSSYDELKLPLLNHANYDFIGDVIRWACEEESIYKIYSYNGRIRRGCDFFFAALEEGAKIGYKSSVAWCYTPCKEWFYVRQKYFYRMCCRMMGRGEVEWLIRMANLCVPNAQDCAYVKRKLREMRWSDTDETCISTGCEKLISVYEFSKLEQLLSFFYPADSPKLRRVVRDLLLEYLELVDSYCLNFYLDGKVSELNEQLAPLISSYPEIILEYKKYLLFSERGLQACCSHLDSTTDVLTEIVSDGLPDVKNVIKFGRIIIFSKENIRKLHNLLRDENFPNDIVKRNIDLLLKSNNNKRKLKQKLLHSLTKPEKRADRLLEKKYLQLLTSLFGF